MFAGRRRAGFRRDLVQALGIHAVPQTTVILRQLLVARDQGFPGGAQAGDGFQRPGLGGGADHRREIEFAPRADHRLDQCRGPGDRLIERLLAGVQVTGDAGDDFSPGHETLRDRIS